MEEVNVLIQNLTLSAVLAFFLKQHGVGPKELEYDLDLISKATGYSVEDLRTALKMTSSILALKA